MCDMMLSRIFGGIFFRPNCWSQQSDSRDLKRIIVVYLCRSRNQRDRSFQICSVKMTSKQLPFLLFPTFPVIKCAHMSFFFYADTYAVRFVLFNFVFVLLFMFLLFCLILFCCRKK